MATINPATQHYQVAKKAFNTGHSSSMWGDQYNKNANQGMEALQKDMAEIKGQLAQNQADLQQIKAHFDITA